MTTPHSLAWIRELAQSHYVLINNHDAAAHLPFNGYNFYPLYADLRIDMMVRAIEKFQALKKPVAEILDLLPTQSSLRWNLSEFVYLFQHAQSDRKTIETIASFFMEAIDARAIRDRFTMAENVVHTPNEIQSLLAAAKPSEVTLENVRALARITMGAATLVHGLYNDFCTDYGYDIFGPYDVSPQYGSNHTLLIRSFPDICPSALWPDMALFPYSSISIYSIYENVHCAMHFIGCHLTCEENLPAHLRYSAIVVDGKPETSVDELRRLQDALLERASAFYQAFSVRSFEEKKLAYLRQQSYQFKKFFDFVGFDWQPSHAMIDRVRGRELFKNVTTYRIPFEEYRERFGSAYVERVLA